MFAGINHTTVVVTDTLLQSDTLYIPVYQKQFNYTDKWITIDGSILDSEVKLNWETRDHLEFILHRKRQGWFKPKLLYIDGKSQNPNTTITNLSNVQIGKERRKRFGIGPYIGYGTRGVDIGIGIHYSFIRF